MIFKLIIQYSSFWNCCEITLMWMPKDLTNGKSTLFQVMVWCRQATSHYLSQGCPKFVQPLSVIRLHLSSDHCIYDSIYSNSRMFCQPLKWQYISAMAYKITGISTICSHFKDFYLPHETWNNWAVHSAKQYITSTAQKKIRWKSRTKSMSRLKYCNSTCMMLLMDREQ